jgi:hypothetical protein
MTLFQMGDRVRDTRKSRAGQVVDIIGPDSTHKETRYRIKWDFRKCRTWFRESGLIREIILTKKSTI